MRRLGTLFLTSLALAGCGGGDQSGSTSTTAAAPAPVATAATATQTVAPTPQPKAKKKHAPKPATGAAKFSGQDRTNYEDAKAVCGAFPAKKVAHDLGISTTDPIRIAQKYSQDYRPAFRPAVYEGCLAGLK